MRCPCSVAVTFVVALATAFSLIPCIGVPSTDGRVAWADEDGSSVWRYVDVPGVTSRYEGGYALQGDAGPGSALSPHGGYDTTTSRCEVCHAVPVADGAYYLLRDDSPSDTCIYCHVGGSATGTSVYDLNSRGIEADNGHPMGARRIPCSTTAQWTREIAWSTPGSNGASVPGTITVRAYEAECRGLYRFARPYGYPDDSGASPVNYRVVGPLALGCTSCHQVHGDAGMTWQSQSVLAMDNSGRHIGDAVAGYKMLKQSPSGTFAGNPDADGCIPSSQISVVPESTLTADANFDSFRPYGESPGSMDLVRNGEVQAYRRPAWVAQDFGDGRDSAALVDNMSLSVWCADCHNLNIGGRVRMPGSELGYAAHTERTHPSPYPGGESGPGQCYSCHRDDLPAVNAGDPCSQCHYGTGDYRENRLPGPGYVASDFPHSGSDAGFRMIGDYAIVPSQAAPHLVSADVIIGPDNLDAVCTRCHGGIGTSD